MFDARQRVSFMGEDRATFDWMYEVTRDGGTSTLIHGMAIRTAESNPNWTYMQVLTYVRNHLKVVQCQAKPVH
jgi:hypothetical protein